MGSDFKEGNFEISYEEEKEKKVVCARIIFRVYVGLATAEWRTVIEIEYRGARVCVCARARGSNKTITQIWKIKNENKTHEHFVVLSAL